jgi:hypothetical protein
MKTMEALKQNTDVESLTIRFNDVISNFRLKLTRLQSKALGIWMMGFIFTNASQIIYR